MSAIFISHRSTDGAAAAALHDWLESEGNTSVFLDFDPVNGIPAGRSWERELYQQIRACRAVIVICSEESMSSKWVFAEVSQARALGKHIIPVKIDDCTIDSVISDRQAIDMTAGGSEEEAYQRLRRGLLASGIDPDDVFDWDGKRPPYPGLLAFTEADAAVFFGRSEETTAGLDLVNKVRRQDSGELVMVLGSSGSGKSSLVRAGLLPRLRRDTERWLIVEPFRPRGDPLSELAAALSASFTDVGAPRSWTSIRDDLEAAMSGGDQAAGDALVQLTRELVRLSKRTEARALFIVDQFEEFLGHAPDDHKTKCLAMLKNAAARRGTPLVLMGTMRSDFLGLFQNSPALNDVGYQSLSVGPLAADDTAQVVDKPAEMLGIELETGLTALLVSDTEAHNALPLLAFTLREMWEKHGAGSRLAISEYRDGLGGLRGAVATVADEVIESQRLDSGGLTQLRQAMLAMVRLTEDGNWARRPARWEDLPASIYPTLERFVDARLLVSSGDGEGATLEVAHEALFESWGLLASWLGTNAEALRLRRDLQASAVSWNEGERSSSDVWRGARLARAIELLDRGDLLLEKTDQEFVEASRQVLQAELDEEHKRHRRRVQISGAVAIGASTLAVIALVFFLGARRQTTRANEQAMIADEQSQRATEQSELAEAEAERANRNSTIALARQARALAATEPALAVAVAAESYAQLDDPETLKIVLETEAALRRSGLEVIFRGHEGSVTDVDFNHDGSRIASVSDDGTALVWDRATGETLFSLIGHRSWIKGVAFNSDGTRIATASSDGTAKVWDGQTGTELVSFTDHTDAVWAVAFSPDGSSVVSAGDDQTARVWDSATGEELLVLTGHARSVYGVAYSPDGRTVATASIDGTAKLWDATSGQDLISLENHAGFVRGVDFNHDGSLLATAGDDSTARIWDTVTGEELFTYTGHSRPVQAVAFNHDGSQIATGANDQTAKVWDPSTGQQIFSPVEHTGPVGSIAFSPDGSLIATAGNDGTVRVSKTDPSEALFTLAQPDGTLRGVAISPDGTRVATAGDDQTARIWDAATGQELTTFMGHDDWVRSVAFNHDGSRVASASDDGAVKIWDPSTGEESLTFRGHDNWVRAADFSSDGTLVASASEDGTAKIWNADTGQVITTVSHNDPIFGVTFNHDDTRIATAGSDFVVHVWDATTGEDLLAVSHDNWVWDVAFNRDGTRLATASADGTARIWDVETGQNQLVISGHNDSIRAVAFNRDGGQLATASNDGTVKVWNADSGSELFTLIGHTDRVRDVAFSADDTRIVTASADGTSKIWQLGIGDPCDMVKYLVTNDSLRDALGGKEPTACTDLLTEPVAAPADPAKPSSSGAATQPATSGEPTILLVRGDESRSRPGWWYYSVTLTGFTPGDQVTLSCSDSAESDFASETLNTGDDGQASETRLCVTPDGPDHWVTAGGVESNRVSWTGVTTTTDPTTTTTDVAG